MWFKCRQPTINDAHLWGMILFVYKYIRVRSLFFDRIVTMVARTVWGAPDRVPIDPRPKYIRGWVPALLDLTPIPWYTSIAHPNLYRFTSGRN